MPFLPYPWLPLQTTCIVYLLPLPTASIKSVITVYLLHLPRNRDENAHQIGIPTGRNACIFSPIPNCLHDVNYAHSIAYTQSRLAQLFQLEPSLRPSLSSILNFLSFWSFWLAVDCRQDCYLT